MAGKVRVKQPEPTVFPHRLRGASPAYRQRMAAHATWKGQESIGRKGKPMLLRVQMKQAKLFGVDFD